MRRSAILFGLSLTVKPLMKRIIPPAKEGSTIVTLKADYVATLSAGEHTIGIVSTSGTATTTFTVNAKTVADNDTNSPQTGDNSMMWL